jgi:hypothetical protein
MRKSALLKENNIKEQEEGRRKKDLSLNWGG